MINNEPYKNSEKDWLVELSRSWMYWYDLVINKDDAGELFDTRQLIVDYLRTLKKEVEENLDKRFVYFICSRPKVRFNINKKPSFNYITGKWTFHITIGKKRRKDKFSVAFLNAYTGSKEKPKFQITEKYITIQDESENKATYSIHDFLSNGCVNLGFSSKVEYVGYTKNPDSRPTNGSHSGLSEILYKVPNDDRDILMFFNLFKVTSKATSLDNMFGFMLANAMTDEIGIDAEGLIIEKCFILYFDASNQTNNKENERSELKNNLLKLSEENKINSIQFSYEFGLHTEYWAFSSSTRSAQSRHAFTARLKGGDPEIAVGAPSFFSPFGARQ
ncbi:hypothetical protein ACIOV9_12730 [Pseudomonas iridis]|uniref:hypothetical protein n=1 Tax=Pseudomonas iridis TaxID=2710587 RepID=UPI003812F87B